MASIVQRQVELVQHDQKLYKLKLKELSVFYEIFSHNPVDVSQGLEEGVTRANRILLSLVHIMSEAINAAGYLYMG